MVYGLIKSLFYAVYRHADFPASFPYKSKAIFAFETIDGTDICFYGMHVQEYGTDAMPPNRR